MSSQLQPKTIRRPTEFNLSENCRVVKRILYSFKPLHNLEYDLIVPLWFRSTVIHKVNSMPGCSGCCNIKKNSIGLYRTKIILETPVPPPLSFRPVALSTLLPNPFVQQEIELEYLFTAAVGKWQKGEGANHYGGSLENGNSDIKALKCGNEKAARTAGNKGVLCWPGKDWRTSNLVSAAAEGRDILSSRSTQNIFPFSNELKTCSGVRLWKQSHFMFLKRSFQSKLILPKEDCSVEQGKSCIFSELKKLLQNSAFRKEGALM